MQLVGRSVGIGWLVGWLNGFILYRLPGGFRVLSGIGPVLTMAVREIQEAKINE